MIVCRKHFEEIRTGLLCDHLRNDRRIAVIDHADCILLTGTGEVDDQYAGFGMF